MLVAAPALFLLCAYHACHLPLCCFQALLSLNTQRELASNLQIQFRFIHYGLQEPSIQVSALA
jgi:hypothetical protein